MRLGAESGRHAATHAGQIQILVGCAGAGKRLAVGLLQAVNVSINSKTSRIGLLVMIGGGYLLAELVNGHAYRGLRL